MADDDLLDYEESLMNGTDKNIVAAANQELLSIRERFRQMEEESKRLKQLEREINEQMNTDDPLEDKMEVDSRSVFVGNVDYDASAEELEQHFSSCGSINRVNIACNSFDGSPKGFAYIEFADIDSVQEAMMMDESLFKGRYLKVSHKRTNRPGISTTNRRPRGRAFYRGSWGMGRGYYPKYHGPRGYGYYTPY